MKDVSILLSKKKIVTILLLSLMLIVMGFFLFNISTEESYLEMLFMRVIAYFCVTFFSFTALYSIYKIFDKNPGLIINNEGFNDNSSLISIGNVKWTNVKEIEVNEINGQKFISVMVDNYEELLSKQPMLKRVILNMNKKHFKTPIHITSNSLNCSFKDLCDIFIEHSLKLEQIHK